MSDEQDKLRLSLEPPKLFGRKKKDPAAAPTPPAAQQPPVTQKPPAPPTAPAAQKPPAAPPVTAVTPTPTAKPTAAPAPGPEAQPAPTPEPVPVVAAEPVDTEAEPTVVLEEPTVVIEDPAPARTAPAAAAKPSPAPPASPAPRPTATRVAERPEPAAATIEQASTDTAPAPSWTARVAAAAAQALRPPAPREVEEDEAPLLSPYRAAALTGAVVGAALVVLTWLALRGCEAVRGTASCGGGPGLLLLLATFVLGVFLGSALLRAFQVTDPGSSSFLAVGIVAVLSLLFLVDVMDHWSMIVVIPLLGVAAYTGSVWVTRTFVEADGA
ncbi:hypothetical protein [Nocardioides sp. GY 10113]|uniref:hypothetical protein n=1 Tax=Nocardioides sp. GY 10113 TaxID=2569761 RepID=UPI0014583ADB|nr:hypothetical protein [Nocardioides sp. GY 10113]